MKDTKTAILDFWFNETQPAQWFQKNDAFDAQIVTRFARDYELGASGIYDAWQEEAQGCVALCVLLDQFPRNMFRNSPKAFATDAKALGVARHTLIEKFDTLLPSEQRRFVYLPFEHSENMDDQNLSVALFEPMAADDPVAYDYAIRHRDVIARFGRFPHRNAVLGRESSDEERAYLAQPDAGF